MEGSKAFNPFVNEEDLEKEKSSFDENLSEDSHLSSTSLVHTLIEKSATDMVEENEDEQTKEIQVVRRTMSFMVMRDTFSETKLESEIDEDIQRRERDRKRLYEEVNLPSVSQKLQKKHRLQQQINRGDADDLQIPLMSKLFAPEGRTSMRRRPTGFVGELLKFIEDKQKTGSLVDIIKDAYEREKKMEAKKSKEDDEENENDGYIAYGKLSYLQGEKTSEEDKETLPHLKPGGSERRPSYDDYHIPDLSKSVNVLPAKSDTSKDRQQIWARNTDDVNRLLKQDDEQLRPQILDVFDEPTYMPPGSTAGSSQTIKPILKQEGTDKKKKEKGVRFNHEK